jgi:hypothetical protein
MSRSTYLVNGKGWLNVQRTCHNFPAAQRRSSVRAPVALVRRQCPLSIGAIAHQGPAVLGGQGVSRCRGGGFAVSKVLGARFRLVASNGRAKCRGHGDLVVDAQKRI